MTQYNIKTCHFFKTTCPFYGLDNFKLRFAKVLENAESILQKSGLLLTCQLLLFEVLEKNSTEKSY